MADYVRKINGTLIAASAATGDLATTIAGKMNSSLKGASGGVAELDSNGKVPSSQLPSYVDDVVEGYYYNSKFYKESSHTTEITAESGKIYVDIPNNKTYRWSGTAYVNIASDLALGETESTAYRGDRGKTAYDHSQTAHARADATKTESSTTNGNIKINGSETTVYTHPTTTATAAAAVKIGKDALGHVVIGDALTAADVGLGNVANKTITVTSTSVSDGTNTFNKYTHPTSAGNKHVPSGGSSGQVLVYGGSSGTASWGDVPGISDKADKVSSATSGHFAGLDSNGNLTDSGKSASDFATSSHTHSVQINGSTKTIAAPGGSPVNLGSYVTDVKIGNTSLVSSYIATIPSASTPAGTSAGATGDPGVVTLEIISI